MKSSVLVFIIAFMIGLTITITKVYIIGVLATSAIKTLSNNCEKEILIEKIFYGKLFCSSTKEIQ